MIRDSFAASTIAFAARVGDVGKVGGEVSSISSGCKNPLQRILRGRFLAVGDFGLLVDFVGRALPNSYGRLDSGWSVGGRV